MEPGELADMRDAMMEAGLSEEVADRLARQFYIEWVERLNEAHERAANIGKTCGELMRCLLGIKAQASTMLEKLEADE